MDLLNRDAAALYQLHLTAGQRTALETYEQLLLDWNERINLTAIRDPEGIRVKHFLDSFSCTLAWRGGSAPTSLIDVGTGAGFPGLPLKILYPDMRLTLVDSIGKKVDFCRCVVDTLALRGVECVQARAEELGRMNNHRERYEWAVARAVAAMPVLAEFLLPLTRLGGSMLAQKGTSGPAEAQTAEQPARLLGGRLRKVIPVQLPGVAEDRYLVVFDKVAATPSIYPRRTGVPGKTPLT